MIMNADVGAPFMTKAIQTFVQMWTIEESFLFYLNICVFQKISAYSTSKIIILVWEKAPQ